VNVTVSDLGEFGLIAAFAARLPRGERTLVGIGDDAAVLAMPDGRVVASVDLLVEGQHFRRDWSGPREIGGKAAAQNLADIAAMGAAPTALLVGLAMRADESVDWVQDLMSGMAQECSAAGATVAGGDLTGAGTGAVMIAVTALGDLAGRAPVTRSGARPGDVLAVTGVLGHSAAGLALLAAGLAEPTSLLRAHRWPQPPYQAGPEAATLGATSMIDVSDGLVADAGHLAQASGVLIDIDSRLLPSLPVLAAAASALAGGHVPAAGEREPVGSAAGGRDTGERDTGERDTGGSDAWAPDAGKPADAPGTAGQTVASGGPEGALGWVLTGGEDHALVATFGHGTRLPDHWIVIGAVRPGRGVRVDGRVFPGRGGWGHFSR
jgi:thiamine-monophosphate kinase